jgi:hypothetical protein
MMDNEVKFWRAMALYLADCHAANAESIGDLKSTSKYNRKRLQEICKTCASLITDGSSDARLSHYWHNDGVAERVADRCARLAPIPYTVTAEGREMLGDG